jgi:alcohol dehydrogenase class IV
MPPSGPSPAAFELATATRIVFGVGKALEAAAAVRALGATRVLLVTGKDASRAAPLAGALGAAGLEVTRFGVTAEPTIEVATAGVAVCRGAGCDAVVAFGGGSALDAGKAVAALAANAERGAVLDYLEIVGRGRPLERPSLPFVAIPSTAGTGSEVTRNAVLASRRDQVKASLRSPHMLPRLAVVDPDLLRGTPAYVLVSSGLDALSQLIEPFLSIRANPLTDALAREGMRRSARSLRAVVLAARGEAADDAPLAAAREDLSLASLMGGLCLANAGLGAVHGFAAPAGGLLEAPHGAICAALLVPALEVNLAAIEGRAPSHPARPRFDELAQLLTGDPTARAAAGLAWLRELVGALEVPGLGSYGLTVAEVPALCGKAKNASSMRGNPLALTDDELREIALRAL